MNPFPTNPGLEAAVVADAEDDTPRLIYADWLEEHGDPVRAEYIRLQCRLADLPPAAPDWADLTYRENELEGLLYSRLSELKPPEGDLFSFGTSFSPQFWDWPFRRGFPYFIDNQFGWEGWTDQTTAQVAAGLERLVRTTTVRGFHPHTIPAARLADLMATPAFADLTGFAYSTAEDPAPACRLLATSPATRNLRQLSVYNPLSPDAVRALASAESLGGVRQLTLSPLTAPADLDMLMRAAWVQGLQLLRIPLGEPDVAQAAAAALGELPELHTLYLHSLAAPAVATLAAGRFAALARLRPGHWLQRDTAAQLARADFPRLTVFDAATRLIKHGTLQALLRADWFSRLRVLDLSDNAIGPRGAAALVAHPVARGLRVLKFGSNPYGAAGMAALTRPGVFPELTTLDLCWFREPLPAEADVLTLVSRLELPRLRNLRLSRLPLGDRGAEAIARSPAYATLTHLTLMGCGIGDAGAKALLESPHLRNLVSLRLDQNAITTGADALADPAVLARLVECRLHRNPIPEESAAKLRDTDRRIYV